MRLIRDSLSSCNPCTAWNSVTPQDFTSSKIVPRLPVLAAWRLVVGVYCLVWWIYNVVWYPDATFFIFLTSWTFTMSTAFFLFGAVLSITSLVQQCRNHDPKQKTKPNYERLGTRETDEERGEDTAEDSSDGHHGDALAWYYKAFWVMYCIAVNVSIVVTVFYYGYFYLKEKNPNSSDINIVNDLTKHVFTTVFLLLETTISGIPVLFFQVVYPLIFAGSYLAFSVIFWLAGGQNHQGKKQIYEAEAYGKIPAGTVILSALLFAGLQLIIQLVLYGIYKLRHRFCEKSSK